MSRKSKNLPKMMARLNPKGLNLTGGSGGAPEFTPEDVAAALGWAAAQGPGPKLAVTVVELRLWPGAHEGAKVTVGHRTLTHYGERIKGGVLKGKRSKWVEKIPVEAPTETASFQFVANVLANGLRMGIQRLYRPQSQPRARGDVLLRMPDSLFMRIVGSGELLGKWSRAVIEEYRRPHHCTNCTNHGKAGSVPKLVEERGKIVGVKWDTCPRCDGRGTTDWGSGRRAACIEVRRADFANYLSPHHNDALTLLRELDQRGTTLIKQRL